MSLTKEDWGCSSLKDAGLWAVDQLGVWAENQLGAYGPTFVRECRIEEDKCLTRCTMFVYALTLLAMLTYAIFGVELTESEPASVWVSPRYVPQFGIEPSYLNQTPEYCEPENGTWTYKCEGDGDWKANPTGCANIPAAHVPQWRIFRESGDGIFVPTAWIYEESQLQPAVSGQCNESQCVVSRNRGPQGQLFCECTKISEKLFVPWTEHNASFSYQMHLEVPDLDVISAGGVNTPYCESFLRDDQFEGSSCTVGDEECLRTSKGVSSMPCRVFLRIPERKQGHPFNDVIAQDPNPMPLHNTEYFSTDLWGLWTVNVDKVLRQVTDLTQSVFEDPYYGNPLLCSFISTGASTDQYLINMYCTYYTDHIRSPTISELQTECEVDCHVGQSLQEPSRADVDNLGHSDVLPNEVFLIVVTR